MLGKVEAHYDYAAFGAVIAQKGDCAEAKPWRFSSEYEDTELGLDYYSYFVDSGSGIGMKPGSPAILFSSDSSLRMVGTIAHLCGWPSARFLW